jgi:hypothetical protein
MATRPLRILVDASLHPHGAIQALQDKGHDVFLLGDDSYDLILGPTAWRMNEELLPLLDEAIKRARKLKYDK